MPKRTPRAKRQSFSREAMVYSVRGGMICLCRLKNISTTGAKLVMADGAQLPDVFLLSFALDGAVHRRCSVIWRNEQETGVRFEPERPPRPGRRNKESAAAILDLSGEVARSPAQK
jgi:hypothetical protein